MSVLLVNHDLLLAVKARLGNLAYKTKNFNIILGFGVGSGSTAEC